LDPFWLFIQDKFWFKHTNVQKFKQYIFSWLDNHLHCLPTILQKSWQFYNNDPFLIKEQNIAFYKHHIQILLSFGLSLISRYLIIEDLRYFSNLIWPWPHHKNTSHCFWNVRVFEKNWSSSHICSQLHLTEQTFSFHF